MTSTRPAAHSHHSHGPPPSGPSSVSLLAQKSHVVAGVRDAYWSDDEEEEEPECPLCIGAMDMDDLNFKPCPCGYQICRFCYHHIKENVNGRCPACRREYSDDTVEYTAMSQDDQKRLQQQKRLKEKEKKELEVLKRAHLPNMRVVQRNVVYVTGLGPRFAKEDVIPSLRSHDYFGQYGKITKIVLVKRNATANREATSGVYITYNRREDAARAISGVDGSPSPGGGGDVMRASYGTTKYCMSFLRNVPCTNAGCMELHEWGDEKDSFTKEDLATLKHAMKDSENRQKFVSSREADSLPRTASWARAVPSPKPAPVAAIPIQTRAPRAGRNGRAATSGSQAPRTVAPVAESSRPARNGDRDRERERKGHAHSSSSGSAGQAAGPVARTKSPPSSSRSATPLSLSLPPRPSTATDASSPVTSPVASSPPPIPAAGDDVAITIIPKRPLTDNTNHIASPPPQVSTPAPPPPPGLTQTYQLSTQAQALLDDVRARREAPSQPVQSPFPDLDRTLEALNDSDFSFSFNLDPKLVPKQTGGTPAPSIARRSSPAFKSQFDPFATVSAVALTRPNQPSAPPGIPPPPGLARSPAVASSAFSASDPSLAMSPASSSTRSPYIGSFDPFSDVSKVTSSTNGTFDDDTSRRASRFGFAQKKATGDSKFNGSAAPSPHTGSELLPQLPVYASSDVVAPAPSLSQQMPQWTYQSAQEYGVPPGISPLSFAPSNLQRTQPSPGFNQFNGFSPFGASANTEAALKELLNIGRNQATARQENGAQGYSQQQGYMDPAIMSMRLNEAANGYAQSGVRQPSMMEQARFGPPPGLANVPPPGLQRQVAENKLMNGQLLSDAASRSQSQSPSSSQLQPSSPINGSVTMPPPVLSFNAQQLSDSPVALSSRPSFSPADFPELALATDRARRHSTTKKFEAKPVRRASQATTQSTPSASTPAKEPATTMVPQVASPPGESEAPSLSNFSTPSTTFSHLKEDGEIERPAGPLATGPNANRTPLAIPAAAPISRKLKRQQARMQAKKEIVAATPIPSLPPSRLPSPPPSIPAPVPEPPMVKAEAPPSRDDAAAPLADQRSPSPALPTDETPTETVLPNIDTDTKAEPLSEVATPSITVPPTPVVDSPAVETPTTMEKMNIHQGPSKRERKILAAKAAAEAAEARAQEIQRAKSLDPLEPERPATFAGLAPVAELMADLQEHMDSEVATFFDLKVATQKWLSLSYSPLADALSALSAPLTDGMPTNSSAIATFQQLLETLTQAISDLLRLLPRITLDDNSSFDSAILDILKAEDFMAEGLDDAVEPDGDVVALTMALERRAKWMKVQLGKLEELHRDINKAAVRAIFALNDHGWDIHGLLPKTEGNLVRFETLDKVQNSDGTWSVMSLQDLEYAMNEAKSAEMESATELKAAIRANIQEMKL